MRAAEHGGIDPRAAQVREVSLGDEPGNFAIRPSFLRERDEEIVAGVPRIAIAPPRVRAAAS